MNPRHSLEPVIITYQRLSADPLVRVYERQQKERVGRLEDELNDIFPHRGGWDRGDNGGGFPREYHTYQHRQREPPDRFDHDFHNLEGRGYNGSYGGYKLKMDIPYFNGTVHISRFFDYMNILEEQQMK